MPGEAIEIRLTILHQGVDGFELGTARPPVAASADAPGTKQGKLLTRQLRATKCCET